MQRAGDGNRTHVSSLEGWCSTIELHPHIRYVITILTNRCYHTTEEPESQRKMQPFVAPFVSPRGKVVER